MRWLRHKKGGGGLIDETSEACASSTVNRGSRLTNRSSVWSSVIWNSIISGSIVTDAEISDSTVEDSIVTGGHIIRGSLVSCELVTGKAVIDNSTVLGESRIAHGAYLENVGFKNLTVTGSARLCNWNPTELFDGQHGYISRGIWERPPQILYLEGDLTITESVPGFAYCGCYEFPIEKWLRCGSRYGAQLGLLVSDVARIREFLISLQKVELPNG